MVWHIMRKVNSSESPYENECMNDMKIAGVNEQRIGDYRCVGLGWLTLSSWEYKGR